MSLVYGLLCGLSSFAAATKWRNYISCFFVFFCKPENGGGIGPVQGCL